MADNDDRDQWVDTGDGHFGPRDGHAASTPKAAKPQPKPKPDKRDKNTGGQSQGGAGGIGLC